MRGRSQFLGAILVLALVVVGGTFLQQRVGPDVLANATTTGDPSGAWFCPHGGGRDWQVTLQLANPGPDPVDVRITRLSGSRPAPARTTTVGPGAEVLLPFAADDRGASSMIEYFGGWVAAGWVAHAGGQESGVAAEPCVAKAASEWFLPDGVTLQNQDAWVVVMNPFASSAVVTLTLFRDQGSPVRTDEWTNVTIRPFRTRAFHLNESALDYRAVGTVIEVPVGRVAAASLGTSGLGGIRSAVGQFAASGRSILPGGFDQGRSEVAILNPPERRATVTGTLLAREGSQPLTALEESPPGGQSAVAYQVTTEGPSTFDIASPPGTAVVRRTFGVATDQASTVAASEPGSAWIVFPAVAGGPSNPGLVLANPSDEPATVILSLLPVGTDPPPDPVTVQIPAGRTVAAPKAFVYERPLAAIVAVATTGTFVPASASYSLGREGRATYAVALGVRVPAAWVQLQP